MKPLFLLFFLCCGLNAYGQRDITKELCTPASGMGQITITQSDAIKALIAPRQVDSTQGALKVRGFRIQVYSGNNSQQSRGEAYGIAATIKSMFPDLPVYTSFQSPRWLCRVGDFRTMEEADQMMRTIKASGKVKEISIVREQIQIQIPVE